MKYKLKVDQWDIQLELVFKVDRSKFTDEKAKEINEFFTGARHREKEHGGHFNAALKLYAAECFQQVAFNNFKDEEWVMDQFDWKKDKGVEGFYPFHEIGLELADIESWHIDDEMIDLEEIREEEKADV